MSVDKLFELLRERRNEVLKPESPWMEPQRLGDLARLHDSECDVGMFAVNRESGVDEVVVVGGERAQHEMALAGHSRSATRS